MDFIEELRNLSARIEKQKDVIQTEEATKMAFVVPFINLLGYDVFNPIEVVPEFIADAGVKKGEKVDYAIFKDDNPIILFECKKYGEDLSDGHSSQLYRYFSVVHARIAVLTDGVVYRFYTDLEEENKMDTKPFLEFNMLDFQPSLVDELKQFSKDTFDIDKTLNAASDLKYTKEIKQIMAEQFESPAEDFVRFFLSYVYNGVKTQSIIQQFTDIVKRALTQFMNESINQRLQSAISAGSVVERTIESDEPDVDEIDEAEAEPLIVTTEEELEGFFTVKSIVREVVEANRIVHRDTINYMSVVLDDSRYKRICRLHFNGTSKYLGLVNSEGVNQRIKIDSIDDIYDHADQLKSIAQSYDESEDSQG